MKDLQEEIVNLEIPPLGSGLDEALETIYRLISHGLEETEKTQLRNDFDHYREKGKWWVHNTFAGGILFLREPENVSGVYIDFCSIRNQVVAKVEFASEERNARNVKYKQNPGKIEQTYWNLAGVFPNFNQYRHSVKLALIAMIGRIVKGICEYYNESSWFMRYTQPFEIKLFLDGKMEFTDKVKVV